MAIKVGISGFGRIARVVIRAAMDMPEIEIAGINVRNADLEYMVYMLGDFQRAWTNTTRA